jgi:endonuclease/exonuclease/phosphatase family metal-dependent hydrolase
MSAQDIGSVSGAKCKPEKCINNVYTLIQNSIFNHGVSLIGTQETGILEDKKFIKDMKQFGTVRSAKGLTANAVSYYDTNIYQYKKHIIIKDDSLNACIVLLLKIKKIDKNLLFINLHKKHNGNSVNVLKDIMESKIPSDYKYDYIIITGDFNEDLRSQKIPFNSKNLNNYTLDEETCCDPSLDGKKNLSYYDFILSNINNGKVEKLLASKENKLYSDHLPVLVKLDIVLAAPTLPAAPARATAPVAPAPATVAPAPVAPAPVSPAPVVPAAAPATLATPATPLTPLRISIPSRTPSYVSTPVTPLRISIPSSTPSHVLTPLPIARTISGYCPLVNNGKNQCYMNSSIQFLYSIPELRDCLKNINPTELNLQPNANGICRKDDDVKKNKETIGALKLIFENLEKQSTEPLEIGNLKINDLDVYTILICNLNFGIYNVEDASEFLVNIITPFECYYDNKYIKTFIDTLLFNQIKITNCDNNMKSINDKKLEEFNPEPLLRPYEKIISIDLNNITTHTTIQALINNYQQTKEIEKGDQVQFRSCRNLDGTFGNNISDKFKLENMKDQKYYIISLKRFDSDNNKINTPVKINKIISINNINFQIEGCILHSGGTGGGHYTYAIYKNGEPLGIMNDSSIDEINETYKSTSEVAGYVFLYKIIPPSPITAPAPISNTNKPSGIAVYGMKKQEIIIPSGRDFMVIKESVHKDDKNNIGLVFKGKDLITVETDLNEKIKKMGGSQDYYNKYLKYKNKYLQLKSIAKLS